MHIQYISLPQTLIPFTARIYANDQYVHRQTLIRRPICGYLHRCPRLSLLQPHSGTSVSRTLAVRHIVVRNFAVGDSSVDGGVKDGWLGRCVIENDVGYIGTGNKSGGTFFQGR